MVITHARVRDEQLELARLRDRGLDRAAISDVHPHPLAADLLRDRRGLLAQTTTSQPSPASARATPAPMVRLPPVTSAFIERTLTTDGHL